MIYSEDINKVCALCVHAIKRENDDESVHCSLKDVVVSASQQDCGRFKYDIFKKVVHRKKRLKTNFDAADFSLD